MVDAITKLVREGALSELLYADDLVLMSETIKGLRNAIITWKEAFYSKHLKGNFGKTSDRYWRQYKEWLIKNQS